MQEQQPDRTKFIGGSDLGKLFSLTPKWGDAYDLWCEKMGLEGKKTMTPQWQEELAFRKRLEPVVLLFIQQDKGLDIVRTNVRVQHEDPDKDYMQAEIDGQTETDNVEAKTTGQHVSTEDWEGEGSLPPSYMLQVQWGMHLSNRRVCHVGLMHGVKGMLYKTVQYDPTLAQTIEEKVEYFWHFHVVSGMPPDREQSIDRDIEEALFLQSGKAVRAEGEILDYVHQLKIIKGQLAEEKKAEERIKEILQTHMKQHKAEELIHEGKKLVTWYGREKESFDAKRFALEHPELYAQYLTRSQSRTFLVK